MFMYRGTGGSFHCLYHDMSAPGNRVGHGYSLDGISWTYGGIAATAFTSFTDGTNFTFPYLERPHFVFAAGSNDTKIVALTNGVKPQWTGGPDQSYTLLRPVQT
jgi:hypothetical protein